MQFKRRGRRSAGPFSVRKAPLQQVEVLESRTLLSKTIDVQANSPGPTHDGTTWATAFKDLRSALAAASAGDTIQISAGTYIPSGAGSSSTFQLTQSIQIDGGYYGYGSSTPDARDPSLNVSILSGSLGTFGGHALHVITQTTAGIQVTLDGLEITQGNAANVSSTPQGGGIYLTAGSLTVNNCKFVGNTGQQAGAMECEPGSQATITNCTFSGNTAVSAGGAIDIETSAVVTQCSFLQNSVSQLGGGGGGAIRIGAGSPVITSCTFSQNTAINGPVGGAVDISGGSATFTNCAFDNNEAGNGGALENQATTTMTNCTFTRNSVNGYGGALDNGGFGAVITLTNCGFYGNSATGEYAGGRGGALNNGDGFANLMDCAFVGNTCSSYGAAGGAIYTYTIDAYSIALNATNCTFADNFVFGSGGFGGAVCAGSPAAITNCIFWGDFAANGPEEQGTVGTYSDIQSGPLTGTGDISIDPRFLRAPSPGPDSVWATADDDYGDLDISSLSPAVDAGDNTTVSTKVVTDLRGNPRFMDVPTTPDSGNGQAPIIDMGAYEAIATLAADAGGPYRALQGQSSIMLHALGSSSANGALQYDWDLNGDGNYDDAHGPDPVIETAALAPGTMIHLDLRLTDAAGQQVFSSSSLSIAPLIVDVDPRADGSGDGTTWNNAETSLQQALTESFPTQVIHVAGGTYTPTNDDNRFASFVLKTDVTLEGGYAGYGAADPDVRDLSEHPSILSGDIGIEGNSSDNSYSVLQSNGVETTAVLDGFTISGGNADGPYSNKTETGGGINLGQSSPTIKNCVFTNNYSLYSGGAIYGNGSNPILTDCLFLRNSSQSGGAIAALGGYPFEIKDCIFEGNSARNGGGAIFSDSSQPYLEDCLLIGNTAEGGAAASDVYDINPPTFEGCTIVDNVATYSGGSGGVTSSQGSTNIINCILWGNTIGSDDSNAFGANVTYSDVQAGHSGTGNIVADPRFDRMPSPGPDGAWGTPDDDYGDLRLQIGSPCIDSGSNTVVPGDLANDFAGSSRIVDFPGAHDPGAIVDMGAYELGMALGVIHVASGQTVALPSGGHAFTADQLLIDNGGTLDMANDQLTTTLPDAAALTYLQSRQITTTESAEVVGYLNLDAGHVEFRGTLPGDANLDGVVNFADLLAVAQNYSSTAGSWATGDFNYDGSVNFTDLLMIAQNYGKTLSA